MTTKPRLEVLISTCGSDGINRVAQMKMPQVDGVTYTISWQKPGDTIPSALASRSDVKIVPNATTGLSNNRNAAFDASTASLLLIADDDLTYTPRQLQDVIDTMEAHPGIDLFAFKQTDAHYKTYPDYEMALDNHFKNYFVTSFELAMRRKVVKGDNAVKFDPQFGVGAPRFHAGEEQLFVNDVLRHGYKARFFPITIVTHKGTTTGSRTFSQGVLLAMGACIRDQFPWYSALIRIPIVAWRNYRAGRCLFSPAIWLMLRGWTYRR